MFSGNSTTSWQFQGGKYVNTNSNAGRGRPFPARHGAGAAGQVGDAGYLDPAGNPVPETIFTGTGQAMVFHGGRLIRGTWSKAGFDSELSLMTQAGELRLPPGKVWIELVPADGGDVVVRK